MVAPKLSTFCEQEMKNALLPSSCISASVHILIREIQSKVHLSEEEEEVEELIPPSTCCRQIIIHIFCQSRKKKTTTKK